jgi:Tol biopolymer transport system component
MRRWIVAVFVMAASVGSWAQGYDPRVAYSTLAGNATSIVLANQDGSKAVKVYSSKTALSGLDFAPGGGRIAFSEFGVLKVLAYSASLAGIAVGGVTTLDPTSGSEAPDFSHDGDNILYIGNTPATREVRMVAAGGGSPRTLMPNMSGVRQVRWVGADRFAYLQQPPPGLRTEVRLVTLDTSGQVGTDELLFSTETGHGILAIHSFDVARTRTAILVSVSDATAARMWEFDLDSRTFVADHGPGFWPHFSSDDSKIVFQESSNYVNILDVAAGARTRLTKKGRFGSPDARP